MKKTIYCFLIFISAFAACKKDDEENLTGDWVRVSDYEGIPRNGAFVFTIDEKAYVGTGYNGTNRLSDTWMFDPIKNNWFEVAVFPGKARSNAVAFAINGKGYVGTGFDGEVALKDFWEYNPQSNTWKEIAPLPVTQGRYDAVAFTIADKGYVGTGKDADNKDQQDFFRYDPLSNLWTKIASIGIKRSGAFSFVLGDKAFVGGGSNNGTNTQEFYQYSPSTDNWIAKKDLDQSDNKDNDDDYVLTRANASTFVINGVGYLLVGNGGFALNSSWRYEQSSDRWTQVDKFEGSARGYGVGFSLNNKGYIATGSSGAVRFDDNWRFDPSGVSDNKN